MKASNWIKWNEIRECSSGTDCRGAGKLLVVCFQVKETRGGLLEGEWLHRDRGQGWMAYWDEILH